MKEPTDEQAERLAEINAMLKQARPNWWPLFRFAWYSVLLLIGTGSVCGAVWLVVSLLRWL